ncbi:MAG: hypothetical protein ACXWTY_12740 [Methylobacter sp.]
MNKNNVVVNFPKPKRPLPGIHFSADKSKVAMPEMSGIKAVFSWLWLVVRYPLFLVLYWLRLPVMMVCNLVSVPLLLAFLFGLFALPEYRSMVLGAGCMSFVAFALNWAYDSLLVWISPDNMFINR